MAASAVRATKRIIMDLQRKLFSKGLGRRRGGRAGGKNG